MRKRMLSAVLSLVLLLALMPTVAHAASDEAISCANALYQLGLFNGTGKDAQGNPNFDLDRTPTRFESVTMLVRLLGRASEAEKNSNTYNTPFVDVVEWAKPYVGYAYVNKLTSGTSGTTFGGAGNATVSQYITFVLRALGYESGVDFQWDKAWELSDKLGITNGQYNSTTNFTRGDVVIISYNALSAKMKGKDTTLLDDLTARGVIKEQTTPNNPDTSSDGHIHNWATRHIDEVGHMESTGTHIVRHIVCKCGNFDVWHDDPDWKAKYNAHYDPFNNGCEYGNVVWEVEKSNGSTWVVDVPEHDETYCTICGQQKTEVTAHTHNWATRSVAEVGHYESSSGTHKVTYRRCDCGFSVNSDDTNWIEAWKEHTNPLTGCRKNYTWWVEDVPNTSQYVVDTPAHDETYCTICGATK